MVRLPREGTFPTQTSPSQVEVSLLTAPLTPCSHLPLPLAPQCPSCQSSCLLIQDLPSELHNSLSGKWTQTNCSSDYDRQEWGFTKETSVWYNKQCPPQPSWVAQKPVSQDWVSCWLLPSMWAPHKARFRTGHKPEPFGWGPNTSSARLL